MGDVNSGNKLRILMIACVPFFSARGTPISIKYRLSALSRLGHEVDLITYHIGADVEIPGVAVYRIPALPLIKEVPVGPSLKKCILDIFVFFKALGVLIRGQYDLIHTHEEASVFGALFSRIFKVRHLYDFHASLPQALKNFGYGKYRPLIYISRVIEKGVIDRSHGVITISGDLDIYVKGVNGRVPTVVLENVGDGFSGLTAGGEPGEFMRSHPELGGKKIVLYAGTFEHYQGLGLLVAAAGIVIKSAGNALFVLAGGRRRQIEALRESAGKLGIDSCFLFTGILPEGELALYTSAADVLISTRIMGDNPPLKIYEYLGAGKPIVATNITAHTQILSDEIAVLVDPEPESVAEGVLSVLNNPSRAAELGMKAGEFFRTHYSPAKNIEKTGKFLDTVMKEAV